MGVYAAKVPLIMGKAAVLAYVAGPTLRSMRVARWPGNTAAGPRCQGEPWNKCPGRWITSNHHVVFLIIDVSAIAEIHQGKDI